MSTQILWFAHICFLGPQPRVVILRGKSPAVLLKRARRLLTPGRIWRAVSYVHFPTVDGCLLGSHDDHLHFYSPGPDSLGRLCWLKVG